MKGQSCRVDRRGNVGGDVESNEDKQESTASTSPDNTTNQPTHPILFLSECPALDPTRRQLNGRTQDLKQHQRQEQSKVNVEEHGQTRRVRGKIRGEIRSERRPCRGETDERRTKAENTADSGAGKESVGRRGDSGGDVGGGNAKDREEDDDGDRKKGVGKDVESAQTEEGRLQKDKRTQVGNRILSETVRSS